MLYSATVNATSLQCHAINYDQLCYTVAVAASNHDYMDIVVSTNRALTRYIVTVAATRSTAVAATRVQGTAIPCTAGCDTRPQVRSNIAT
jgi:hypothetical protein